MAKYSPVYSALQSDVDTINIKLDFKIDPKKGQEELAKFGYYYNENGECRSLKKNKRVKQFATQQQYEAFSKTVTQFIFYLLRNHYKMTEIEIQNDINTHKMRNNQNYASSNIRPAKIFLSPQYGNKETLLLLIPITGAVKTGMWSRSVCINDSLGVGSMFPFISECYRKNWGVVLFDSSDTKFRCSMDHVLEVYDDYIERPFLSKPNCTIKHVLMMCFADGSHSALHLVQERSKYLMPRLRGIALCCAVLHQADIATINDLAAHDMIINWVASSKQLGTELKINTVPKMLSSGHSSSFYGPANAIHDIFAFFEVQTKTNIVYKMKEMEQKSDEDDMNVPTKKGIVLMGYAQSGTNAVYEEKGDHRDDDYDMDEEKQLDENQCKTRFKKWICNTVKLPQYLSCFEKNGYDDIRLIEFFDEDTIKNEIGIDKKLHVKLILKKAEELKTLQVQFDAVLERNERLKEYKQELEGNGILTVKQLKKGIQSKEELGRILDIKDENETNLIWNIIHPESDPVNAEEGHCTVHH